MDSIIPLIRLRPAHKKRTTPRKESFLPGRVARNNPRFRNRRVSEWGNPPLAATGRKAATALHPSFSVRARDTSLPNSSL
uniref:Uncharacterized protein n=1 Tax=Candidatus Kentrum sp. LPFa TaxID=2126335 RepID=A0A450WK16_9GAMM|nr:MAG: hypothetical protein BECKLPF1236B_GA0070989_11151 [Candidatus Kentron sp. LPFa]